MDVAISNPKVQVSLDGILSTFYSIERWDSLILLGFTVTHKRNSIS